MGSEFELITKILDLPGVFVKEIFKKDGKIFITVEHTGYPTCPCSDQLFIETPKDRRYQVVEDVL